MGCNSSKSKKQEILAQQTIAKRDTGGTRTQRVLNSWDVTTPIPAPYPQGKADLNKILKTDSYLAGTVYDPNPEIVPYNVEGEYVPANEFYAITPVQPLDRLDGDEGRGDAYVVNEFGRVVDTNSRVVIEKRQREVMFA